MKTLIAIIGITLICETLSTYIDVFETTNGHEPQVAINCGKVPFFIDLETGAWVADSEGVDRCDIKKKKVLRYCQKRYPNLNITNIVEANEPVKFNNWCEPGHVQCDEAKEVVPYRCLVEEYEADALMVPNGCKFDHIHHEDMCLSKEQWKNQAAIACKTKYDMTLLHHGILLPCDVDLFTGVEYVCCPKEDEKVEPKKVDLPTYNIDDFYHAIKRFQKYLPLETKGCNRSTYITKQTELEDRHRDQIAAVVDEWDETEKIYNELKVKDPVAAEKKMKRTLEVFRQTLAALEQESKDEKSRLRAEHADCINTQINKNKRDAMIAYLAAIEEEPVDSEKILQAVRKFIQVCEHDRVHNLRHFEHVRNRNPEKAEAIRGELLQHLKDLNKVVNDSMALLNYLPEIAEEFGITGSIGGAILKPRLELPTDDHSSHDHDGVKEILETHAKKQLPTEEFQEVPTDAPPMTNEEKPSTKEYGSVYKAGTDNYDDDEDDDDELFGYEDRNEMEERMEKGVETIMDNTVENEEDIARYVEKVKQEGKRLEETLKRHDKPRGKMDKSRSPFAFNAVMGLSCGVLVIMLLLVIALIVRRRRINRPHVVLSENNDEREHLVEMQKNGFENPTYKFFYY